jgi:AraC-like DNA-binding protein
MSLNSREIIQQVDLQLKMDPNPILQAVARKLGISPQLIEDALRETEGLSFQEYQANKRLEQAFEQLGELSIAANGPCEKARSKSRVIILKAAVRYRIHGFWRRKSGYSPQCPLVDFSSDGLALLADRPVLPQKRIEMILRFLGEEAEIKVKGRVVYSVATGIAGYRYRIGIEFLPFGKGKRGNPLQALETLTRLEKVHTS